MNRYKTILFDLDGTLLDSRTSIVEATYETICHFRPGALSYEEVNARFGQPFSEFVSMLDMESQADAMLLYYLEQVEKNQSRLVQVYPFVCETIPVLKNEYQLAIVTNKERRLTLQGLDKFGLTGFFDTIVCIDDVRQGKPSAEPIQKAIRQLQSAPEQCLMVGDTEFDIKAARNAGVDSALLCDDSQRSDADRATHVFQEFRELADYLLDQKLTVTTGRNSR